MPAPRSAAEVRTLLGEGHCVRTAWSIGPASLTEWFPATTELPFAPIFRYALSLRFGVRVEHRITLGVEMGSKQRDRSSPSAVEETIKPRKKKLDGKASVVDIGGRGEVLQVLYDYDLEISAKDAERVLLDIDARCDSSVKLILTGGAFMWICRPEISRAPKHLLSAAGLKELTDAVRDETRSLVKELSSRAKRDFVIGVDVYVGEEEDRHAGQFAVVIRRNVTTATIIPKMLPVGGESGYLAGFGTAEARRVPHVVDTALGRTLVLVCHDAQAFNHFTKAKIDNADGVTGRERVVNAMRRQLKALPTHALNLVHWVERAGNLKTFRVSYKQLQEDHQRLNLKEVVGAFGFDGKVNSSTVAALATSLRRPWSSTPAYAIVR